jgi:hypothetical protein
MMAVASQFLRKPEKREAEPGARGVERKSFGGANGINMSDFLESQNK